MTGVGDHSGLDALLRQVTEARGIRCEAYKESCLRRRVAVRMRACGVHTYRQYARRLVQDATEYDRLLDALTINVTTFYRNAEMWDRLRESVLPELWDRRGRRLRCWSAGCASGEEAYTLAALLVEAAAGATRSPDQPSIDATDFDRTSLQKAQAARYPGTVFEEMPPALSARYFPPDPADKERRCVVEPVRQLVRFFHHDVTRSGPPHPPYDLILFRNVVIYFDRATQERLFACMAEALAPGGVLVLGKVESLYGEAREMLDLEDIRERIYRRP